MRSCSCFLLILCLLLPAGAALAREATVTPVEIGQIQTLGPQGPTRSAVGACQVGNLNPSAWAVADFIYPPEYYALVFDPAADCGTCGIGLRVSQVHIILRTTEAMTLEMGVGLRSADTSNPSCPAPGALECQSSYTVNVPGAGSWDVALPVTCECAYPEYLYLLDVAFLNVTSAGGTVPDLITDNDPTPCVTWNDYGFGPEDVVTAYDFPGNLLIYADVSCCEQPVGADDSSVGRFKGGYED